MKRGIYKVHKLGKSFQKQIEMHAHFEWPCNKLKNVTSKLKILNQYWKITKNSKTTQFYVNFTSVFKLWF